SSGSTAAPSSAAVHLRAGWTLGGVQDTYLRYEVAGDLYTGQVVSGLPVTSRELAILCPLFLLSSDKAMATTQNGKIDDIVNKVFGRRDQLAIPPLSLTLRFCLASLLAHFDFLHENAGRNAIIRSCPLFRTDMSDLLPLVAFGYSWEDRFRNGCRATGIPPHAILDAKIEMLRNQSSGVKEKVLNLDSKVSTLASKVSNLKEELVDDRALGAGMSAMVIRTIVTVAYNNASAKLIHDVMTGTGKDIGKLSSGMVQPHETYENNNCNGIEFSSINENRNEVKQQRPLPSCNIHLVGGRFSKVPAEWDFPKGGVLEAWSLWICGDAVKCIPPLRQLTSLDVKHIHRGRKKLSELADLMRRLDAEAKAMSLMTEGSSEVDVATWYAQIQHVVEVPNPRQSQLTWATIQRS
ncbi:MAG: hypothetical protein ACREOZ_00975, partial [Gloeomargaritales cyanobacterium]